MSLIANQLNPKNISLLLHVKFEFQICLDNCYFPYTLRVFTDAWSPLLLSLKAPHFPMNFFAHFPMNFFALFSVPIETFPMLDN
jgi:hypothetical protein